MTTDRTNAEMDRIMRAQMVTDPETGGPRDPAIGPHPRFREMDARREARLHPQAAEADDSRETERGAYVTRELDRITFTLTRTGVRRLAEQFGRSVDDMAAFARDHGWRVET
jgi:hypothetical protein